MPAHGWHGASLCSLLWEEAVSHLSLAGVWVLAFPPVGKWCLLLEQEEERPHLFLLPRPEFLKHKSRVLVTLKLETLG